MKEQQCVFIENAGGCLVSKNITTGKGKLTWCLREDSVNRQDNGWRFFSDIDTDVYLSDADNLEICDFNTVANIEPAVTAIFDFPVGTDLELVRDNGKMAFYDNLTGQLVYPKVNE